MWGGRRGLARGGGGGWGGVHERGDVAWRGQGGGGGDSILSGFFFSSRRRHTRCSRDWSSDVCSSDLTGFIMAFQWYTFLLLNPVWNIVNSFSELQRSLAAMERVFEVVGMEDDKPDRPGRSEERRVGKEGRSRWRTED